MYNPSQRLMRSRTDKYISGVSGGIARYLAVDPVFVRLGFVALAFSGIGFLIYPILWLIMPLEPLQPTATGPQSYARVAPQPISQEVPSSAQTSEQDQAQVQARRKRLLGIILVSIGSMIVVNMIDPGIMRWAAPLLFIAAGYLLLRRSN